MSETRTEISTKTVVDVKMGSPTTILVNDLPVKTKLKIHNRFSEDFFL